MFIYLPSQLSRIWALWELIVPVIGWSPQELGVQHDQLKLSTPRVYLKETAYLSVHLQPCSTPWGWEGAGVHGAVHQGWTPDRESLALPGASAFLVISPGRRKCHFFNSPQISYDVCLLFFGEKNAFWFLPSWLYFYSFLKKFYCYSITVVCCFSPSLHPTPAEPPLPPPSKLNISILTLNWLFGTWPVCKSERGFQY